MKSNREISHPHSRIRREEDYQSFVLRMWRTNKTEPWRASLEDVATGDSELFVDIDALVVEIRTKAASPVQDENDDAESHIAT